MGLFVSTVSADVAISDLGLLLAHPTVDRDLGAQFTGDEISRSIDLEAAIRSGLLTWADTAGGAARPSLDYDKDYWDAEEDSSGSGNPAYELVRRDEVLKTKSGRVTGNLFAGNPKTYSVVFAVPFPDNNYSVMIGSQTDGRTWLGENVTLTGFTINAQANKPITGIVNWVAEYEGESK